MPESWYWFFFWFSFVALVADYACAAPILHDIPGAVASALVWRRDRLVPRPIQNRFLRGWSRQRYIRGNGTRHHAPVQLP